jgi:hypothetical protein
MSDNHKRYRSIRTALLVVEAQTIQKSPAKFQIGANWKAV